MNALDWLIGRRLVSAERLEYQWLFRFEHQALVMVEDPHLWRMLEDGRIRLTNHDDGHQFGLPAPFDAADWLNRRLAGALVTSVVLNDGTLDLKLFFEPAHVLEIFPSSGGYESWNAVNGEKQFIAVGGGKLAILDDVRSTG